MLGIVLAVLVYAPDSGQAGTFTERVHAALVEAAHGDALPLAQKRAQAGWMPLWALDGFARAERLLAQARHDAEHVELDAAARAYADAERLYDELGAVPLVEIPWAQAALERGVVLFQAGYTDDARASWARARALDPTLVLTERTVRPDVARAFAEAAASPTPGVLRVEVEPAPTAMWIDGVSVPVGERFERPTGLHRVVAQAGRARAAAFVAAGLDDQAATRLILPKDGMTTALAGLAAGPSAEGVRVVAELTGADGAVGAAIAVDAGQLTLVGARWDARGCATTPVTVVAGRADTISAEQVARAARGLVERVGGEPPLCGTSPALVDARAVAHPRPVPAPPAPRPLYKQPWFWATTVALSAAAVVLGVTLAPIETSYRASVSGSAFSGAARP